MKLIQNKFTKEVSNDTVLEFENVLLDSNQRFSSVHRLDNFYKFKFLLFRIFRKFGIELFLATAKKCRNPLLDKNHLFVIMMNLDEYKLRPHNILTRHGRSVYLFDAWPKDHRKIAHFINQYKVDYLFVTASQAALKLSEFSKKTIIQWIPEGINPALYKQFPHTDRSIDVLALGRKHNAYHEQICMPLKELGYTYLYEKVKGELVFPTREEFIEGLANSKISICVPSNITHPERAGDVETMTIRYLQSMVSKCIVVGHAPVEMIELFGYNPVIEIDYVRPTEQIVEILSNYDKYISLVERNYSTVITNHTWKQRWEQIQTIYLANSNH